MSGAERMPEGRRAGPTCLHPGPRSDGGWPRRLIGVGSLAGLVLALAASSPQAQTLTQALAETYNTNPQLLAQRALLRATDEQVPQALSFWRPTVNFTGQVGFSTNSLDEPLTGRRHILLRPDLLQFQANQPIYRGGRTEAQTRQAINTVESTRAQTLAVETTVFQAVAMAYLDVVRDQALVEVNRNNVEVLRKQLEATQDRFRVGEVTRTDVAQAEASLAQAQGQLVNQQGQLEVSRAEYVRAVGHPATPALLKAQSRRPYAPTTAVIISRTSASRDTSPDSDIACPPAALTRPTVSRAASSTKSAAATRAPSRAKASAVARPMPPPPPVISVDFPSSIPAIAILLDPARSDHCTALTPPVPRRSRGPKRAG